jgi:hypothetical protein
MIHSAIVFKSLNQKVKIPLHFHSPGSASNGSDREPALAIKEMKPADMARM